MIYISVQPDSQYFIWQIELQLRNFKSLGINKDRIHVLFSYSENVGINPKLNIFIENNRSLAQIFIYPDLRINPNYTSSIRPHILAQHFSRFRALEKETFFYHDSDILLSRLPVIPDIDKSEICYVSDTRSYLDLNYIRESSSEVLLDQMLAQVGLNKKKLETEDHQSGGAQYILKNISSSFWKKVEKDAEGLYQLMRTFNLKKWEEEYSSTRQYRGRQSGIQAWCADMWAVLWNLWYFEKKIEIHDEMSFSWPYNQSSDWFKYAIQHYSGNIQDPSKHFSKTIYINYAPWFDSALDTVAKDSCSHHIVKLIKSRRQELNSSRKKYERTLILLEATNLNSSTIRMFNINKIFINKYFDVDIVLILNDSNDVLHDISAPIFQKNTFQIDDPLFEHYNKFILFSCHTILGEKSLSELLNKSLEVVGSEIVKYNQFKMDILIDEIFSKILEVNFLEDNQGKLNQLSDELSIFIGDRYGLKEFWYESKDTTLSKIKFSEQVVYQLA